MSEAVEFGSRPTANEFREEFPDFICPIDDDRREATVHFTSDTPESVLDRAEAAATSEQAKQDRSPLKQEPLTDSERAGLDFSREGVNTAKARYLKGLGAEYGLDPFEHVDLAEIDGVEDARPILESARRTGGTGRGGGTAQYDDTASEREDRQRRERAERQASEGCDHARGACENGDPEACEHLQRACGYSPERTSELLSAEAGRLPYEELPGEEKGALARAWNGYQAALATLDRTLPTVADAFENAEQAAAVIADVEGRLVDDDQVVGADRFERLATHHQKLASLTGEHPEASHGQPETRTGAKRVSDTALAGRQPDEPPVPARPEPPSDDEEPAFSVEKQDTLAPGVESEQVAEDKQVTLTGDDEGASSAALPSIWTRSGDTFEAGPFAVAVRSNGPEAGHRVELSGPDHAEHIASKVPTHEAALNVAREFTDRLDPADVSFHSSNSAVPQAAAEAKDAADLTAGSGQETLST